jgi:hypothetical protein
MTLPSVVRASVVFLSLAGLCMAGRFTVGGSGDPTTIDITGTGVFNVTPDASGGGIFELINDGSSAITALTVNLSIPLPGTFLGGSSVSPPPGGLDGALAGLQATIPYTPNPPATDVITDTFLSYLFTSVNFLGAVSGDCGTIGQPSTSIACLTIQFSGGASVPVGGNFILDLNTNQTPDICMTPGGCNDGTVPYGGLLPTANDSGAGDFSGTSVGGGSNFSAPEPPTAGIVLSSGLFAAFLYHRRRKTS